MTIDTRRIILLLLQFAPLILFAILFIGFGLMSDRFLSIANFRNILTQSTHAARQHRERPTNRVPTAYRCHEI